MKNKLELKLPDKHTDLSFEEMQYLEGGYKTNNRIISTTYGSWKYVWDVGIDFVGSWHVDARSVTQKQRYDEVDPYSGRKSVNLTWMVNWTEYRYR